MSKILFLTLRTFSATGGIEKVCRIMGKALYEDAILHDNDIEICSMYDRQRDAFNNPYFPSENFHGFGINKIGFIRKMVHKGVKSDTIILSHINLLLIGFLIKARSPKTKLILMAHGIEIWYPLSRRKRKMLHFCEKIWAVSKYTKERVVAEHRVPAHKCDVLNNCIDPFVAPPTIHKKNKKLLHQYGFTETDTILMSLTRVSSRERYKGYDKVIEAMATLQPKYPGLKYLIAGSYDTAEKDFIDGLIRQYSLQNQVVMPGYIEEEELEDHFGISDIYVMPSRKEGFGIVFIEAMYYGLPVIAGNIDGSADALLQGKLGQLVNPDDVFEIAAAIENVLKNTMAFSPERSLLTAHFGYEVYKQKLEDLLHANSVAEMAVL